MSTERLASLLRSVGANVRRLRIKKGLTQAQLSEAADLETRFLQQVEAARSNITLATLLALADALRVHPGHLLKKATPVARPAGRPKTKRSAKRATSSR
ncbi:MAG: helix-turn-helix domain-containing protein [Polyangiaceae bacterium]|nr:helix-turn-helix domain-containing protein [Polyangiaceae bacterium]